MTKPIFYTTCAAGLLIVMASRYVHAAEPGPLRIPQEAETVDPPEPRFPGYRNATQVETLAVESQPSAVQKRIVEKGISSVSVDTTPPSGILPPNPAAKAFAGETVRGSTSEPHQSPLRFGHTNPAFGFCHRPVYFEQVRMERYGLAPDHCATLHSAAHFFGAIPALPYKMVINKPGELVPSWGPRSPCRGFRGGRAKRATVTQAAVISGLILALP